MRNSGRRNAAFSLLELLVIITIILIFAAITIPFFSKMAASTHMVKCINNLRILHLAMNNHLNENNGRFPEAYNDPLYGGMPYWGPTWAEYLAATQLRGDRSVLHCPGRPKKWTNAAGYYPDYGYNAHLGNKRVAQIAHPSQTVLFMDSGYPDWRDPIGGFYAVNEATRVHFRHSGETANVLFVDGHIGAVRRADAIPLGSEGPLGFKAFDPSLSQ